MVPASCRTTDYIAVSKMRERGGWKSGHEGATSEREVGRGKWKPINEGATSAALILYNCAWAPSIYISTNTKPSYHELRSMLSYECGASPLACNIAAVAKPKAFCLSCPFGLREEGGPGLGGESLGELVLHFAELVAFV
jgi:hypothetical protein